MNRQLTHNDYIHEVKKFPIYLILDNINDIVNIGSIFRISDALRYLNSWKMWYNWLAKILTKKGVILMKNKNENTRLDKTVINWLILTV